MEKYDIKTVRCADDAAILSVDEEVLQNMSGGLIKIDKNYVMKIKIEKSKAMGI